LLCIAEAQVWTKVTVLQLLGALKSRYHRLTDKFTKSKNVWREIAQEVGKITPGVTDSQCDQKWRNLKRHWKAYVDGQKKTGQGRKARPEFYDEIGEILASSHTIHPPHVLETLSVDVTPSVSVSPSSVSAQSPTEPSPQVSNPSTTTTPTATVTSATADITPAESDAPRRKRLKPSSTKETLEQKVDLLMQQQTAAQQRHEQEMRQMRELFEKQHAERMNVMKGLIKAVRSKKSKKSKKAAESSSSDS